jgi:NTE family protein
MRARASGADIVLCSDVADPLAKGEQLRSMSDVLMQTITFQMQASTAEQRALCDIYIRPDISGLSE